MLVSETIPNQRLVELTLSVHLLYCAYVNKSLDIQGARNSENGLKIVVSSKT